MLNYALNALPPVGGTVGGQQIGRFAYGDTTATIASMCVQAATATSPRQSQG